MSKPQRSKKRSTDAPVAVESEAHRQSARANRRSKTKDFTHGKTQEALLVGGVLIVAFLAYLNSTGGEFTYDDRFQVLKNPTLQTLSNIPRMFTQSVWQFMNAGSDSPVGNYYRPIFNAALIFQYHLFGLDTVGWHVVSILLHLAVTFLVYRLARRWDMSQQTATAAALMFGLHPIHSESVAWISGLPDPLAALFILGSLLLYERCYHGAGERKNLLIASLGLAMLALLSKEVAVAFPVFLLVREWLDRPESEPFPAILTKTIRRVAPFLIAVIVYLGMRFAVLGFLDKTEPKAEIIPAFHVFLTIPSILLSYVRLLFIPYPLAIAYKQGYVTEASDPRFWGSLLAVTAILAATVWLVRRSQTGRRALAFMILFMLPVLNLKAFNQQESLIHDRYLYLPSIGFCLLAALALEWLAARLGARQKIAFQVAVVLIAVIFFGLTLNQNRTWQNDLAMANNALRLDPTSPFLHNYIGAYYAQAKNFAFAEKYYQQALADEPKYYDALTNLGDIYREEGRLGEAEQAYQKAIEYGSPYANTYYNLGVIYTSQGRLEEARQALIQTLEIMPSNTAARYNLGWAYDKEGKNDLAEQEYRKTLEYNPAYPEPRINLAGLLSRQGRIQDALEQLQIAQQYAPEHSVMLYNLGDTYMRMGRYQEAVSPLTQLIRQDPRNPKAYTSLGLCYERLGDKEQAKTYFQKAVEVAPDDTYTNVARERLAAM